ncbi:MAG: hypothetical protein R2809_14745, partial [Flavobacteriales bacterium]
MSRIILLVVLFFHFQSSAQELQFNIVTTDIENYWTAYDKVVAEQDSAERIRLIHEYYLDKGTDGLSALVEVRRYQDFELVSNMLLYPNYWNSIRGNTDLLVKDI